MLVKDNIDVKGMHTTAGSYALNDLIAERDAFLVRRLKEAGAVILGKANLSEFAYFMSRQGIRSGYVLVIGTGIGGAYVRNGRIEAGSHGYGGQISRFLTDDIRRNGLNAIWSAHCGMPGFLAKAKQRMQKEDLDGEILMKLVREKDEQACGLLDEYMNEFTNVLFTLQMVLDPERFVIGGGISRDDLFIKFMRNKYEEIYRMYSLDVKHADIMPCRFHNTSNIMGALALYYDEHQ